MAGGVAGAEADRTRGAGFAAGWVMLLTSADGGAAAEEGVGVGWHGVFF